VCPEHFAQLLLLIPAGFTLHFKAIIFQFERGAATLQTNDIAALLQKPGRLLVTKLSGQLSNSDRLPTVLCVYTGVPRELAGYNFDPVTKRICQMVFGLYPAHTVYHASLTKDTEHELEIRAESDNLTLGLGALKMDFLNGMRRLRFTTGATTTMEGEVEGLEIWTM
jgi:hypothetical protein